MYTSEDIRRVQRRLLEMAVVIRDILESHNIPYFITYGTLLGAVRHQGFIPWDDDFDFYLFDDSYDKAIHALRAEMPVNMFLEDEESEPLYFHGWAHVKDTGTEALCELFPQDNLYTHHGISIDLYRAYKIKKSEDRLNRLNAHIKYLNRKLNKGSFEVFLNKKNDIVQDISIEQQQLLINDTSKDEDWIGFISVFNDSMPAKDLFPLKKYKFEKQDFWGPSNAEVLLKACYGDYMCLPPEEKRKPHYSEVLFK